MIGAALSLTGRSLVTATRRRVARLRQPKYLIGLVVGGLYFYWFFFRPRRGAGLGAIASPGGEIVAVGARGRARAPQVAVRQRRDAVHVQSRRDAVPVHRSAHAASGDRLQAGAVPAPAIHFGGPVGVGLLERPGNRAAGVPRGGTVAGVQYAAAALRRGVPGVGESDATRRNGVATSARRAARTGQPLGPRLVEPAPCAPRHRGGLPGRLHAGLRGVDECHAFRRARGAVVAARGARGTAPRHEPRAIREPASGRAARARRSLRLGRPLDARLRGGRSGARGQGGPADRGRAPGTVGGANPASPASDGPDPPAVGSDRRTGLAG